MDKRTTPVRSIRVGSRELARPWQGEVTALYDLGKDIGASQDPSLAGQLLARVSRRKRPPATNRSMRPWPCPLRESGAFPSLIRLSAICYETCSTRKLSFGENTTPIITTAWGSHLNSVQRALGIVSGMNGWFAFSRYWALGIRRIGPLFATAVCAAWYLAAQDLDLVLYAGDPAKRTMLDQIEDPEEHAAFEELRSEMNPARKRTLAEAFLLTYPQSWLVTFAHSMAAHAAIALDDLQAGLDHGRRSIRLLPENRTLLVALANVQVHEGLLDEAERSARDALEYLTRFDSPAEYSKLEWAKIEAELKASSYYVLGRVEATRGLQASGKERTTQLAAARRSLQHSVRGNTSDTIALYLLGVVERALGNETAAQSALAKAAHTPGPVQAQALEGLRSAYRTSSTSKKQSFGEFHAAIPPFRPAKVLDESPPTKSEQAPGVYAGSQSCDTCHKEIVESWSKTGMARMFRNYAPENVIGDFERNNELRGPDGEVLCRMFIEEGHHYFEFPVRDAMKRFRVDYTIGSKWQQAYATRLSNGRIHVFPVQYNRLHESWVNFWEILDDGPSERSIVANFHRMQSSTNYQIHCSPCHTSQVQAEGAVLAAERITFRETGINCEMCHGPSQAHVIAVHAGRSDITPPGTPPLRFDDLDHRTYVNVCAQCHMQSGIVQTGPKGEINYSGEQEAFLQPRQQRPYEEYSRKAFYKDGRFRETTFIVESFLRTECFRQGEAHCGHCHDPHPRDSASNPTSLKFREDPNRMCLQCHARYDEDLELHTRHAAGSGASLCTTCHMPKIMNSMMFLASTHRIDDIPDAVMTERFGQQESPNVCLECHPDESASWVARALADW